MTQHLGIFGVNSIFGASKLKNSRMEGLVNVKSRWLGWLLTRLSQTAQLAANLKHVTSSTADVTMS